MTDKNIAVPAGILATGLAVQAASFFFLSGATLPVLPAFACIAAVIYGTGRISPDYIKAGITGLAAGILFLPFAGTPTAAAGGIIACPAGAVAALAVFSEMKRNGEGNFSPVFSVFSGSMIAGMFIMAARLAGAALPGPGPMLREFTSLLLLSLLAGVLCQGILIVLKLKTNDSGD